MKTTQALIVMCVLGCQLQAQVSFNLSASPGAGNDPNSAATADANGDGKMDLISANYYGNSLSVLTNNGSGGFVLFGTYTVGNGPRQVVSADVNGDGKVDLIAVNQGSSTLTVLTNNGNGGFVLASSPVVGSAPTCVTAADVNGDGKVDLISANWGSGGGNTLTVLTNNGSGGFVFASTLTVGSGPVWVAAADVNGDGKVDLISANWGSSGGGNTLTVLTNNGSGGFVLASSPVVGSGPYMVTAADVNGDGKVDLASANWGSSGGGNTLTVLTNSGSGIFGSNATVNVGSGSIAVAAADVNGDGNVDLISANYYANSLSVLTNNGVGGFVLATNLSVVGHPNSVTAADVNGDGKVDLISPLYPTNVLALFTNATPFPIQQVQVFFKLSSSPGVGNDPRTVAAADVNGDGKMDLISANYYGGSLSVLTNNGSGGFVLSGTYTVGTYPLEVVTADVNGDGKVDLICANSGGSTLSVLTNNGSGGFVLAGTYPVGLGPLSVKAADVNGDGKVDLITANWGSAGEGNTLTMLTNNGSGGFVFASTLAVGHGSVWVTAADVNGDGKVDLISANWGASGQQGNTLTVLTNNGSGGFVLASSPVVGSGPYMVTAADVNGDGKVDLITANWGSSGGGNTLTVLTNSGSGIFGSNATVNVGTGSIAVAAADVNGDGKVDLISANYYANSLSVLTNNGNGGFVLATNLSAGGNPNSVTAADVNGDGKVDLISPLGPNNVVAVFTNATPFPSSCDPVPSGLVSWWQAEGNANDSAGTNNGTLIGGVTYTNGEVGRAFSLDGTSGSVFVPASSSLNVGLSNGFTIEGWINPATTATLQPVVEWKTGGNSGVHFWISADNYGGLKVGSLYANVVDTSGGYHSFASGSGIIVSNQFQHVALTYDKTSGVGRLYLNGLVVTQQNLGIFTPRTSYNLYLGNRPGTAYFWSGLLDEISVYSRALSSNEIAAIYNAGSAGKCQEPSVFIIITNQPQSQTNIVGATVTFQVGVTSSIPVGYQWRKNSTNLVEGGNLSGSRTNTLTIMNISGGDAGIYSVIVSNASGSVTSSNAVLTVLSAAPAIGTAIFSGSFVTGVNIIDGGRGYTNTPLVRFIGGGGSGAGAFAVVSNGVVTSITVTNAGFGYTSAPQVVIDPPLIFNPVLAIAPMSFLSFSNLTVGGVYQLQQSFQWYWTNQSGSFMASNALFTQMVAGAVGGGNYRLALNPAPTQAFATPQVVNGFVVGATVTSGGSGYVTSPGVSIVGGHGTNATAVSHISGGVVTSISIVSPGAGYTNTPMVEIAPPPAAAVSPTVFPVMRVDSANLAPYYNYQIQFKPDITSPWINWDGGLFSPTDITNSQFIFITNSVGHFRVQYVP